MTIKWIDGAPVLPCRLSEGITATWEGLSIDAIKSDATIYRAIIWWAQEDNLMQTTTILWPDVAERLRYREGEPWCTPEESDIFCGYGNRGPYESSSVLHRLAVILCDDADAFRVLYWCAHSLGDER